MKKIIGLVLVGVLVLGGCEKEEEKAEPGSTTPEVTAPTPTPTPDPTPTPAPTPNPGSSMADLAGDGQFCTNIGGGSDGSVFAGGSAARKLTLGADGSFGLVVAFGQASCNGNGIDIGGDKFGEVTMSGTYSVDGGSEDVPTATKVTFTITSQSVIVHPGASFAHNFKAGLQSQCPTLLFASNTQVIPAGGAVCTDTMTWTNIQSFLPQTQTYKQIVEKSAGTLRTGAAYFIRPGPTGAYPTTLSNLDVYLGW